jgi:hypothetical protein
MTKSAVGVFGEVFTCTYHKRPPIIFLHLVNYYHVNLAIYFRMCENLERLMRFEHFTCYLIISNPCVAFKVKTTELLQLVVH